jgi:hypothetical protein
MRSILPILEDGWDLKTISQNLYFVEEETPDNKTQVHRYFYDQQQAERFLAELETQTLQAVMNDKNFATVAEAQAFLLDRDADYALAYSRYRLLTFRDALDAFGYHQLLAYISSADATEDSDSP